MRRVLLKGVVLLLLVLSVTTASACTLSCVLNPPLVHAVEDGSGGAIFAWESDDDIWTKRIDAEGKTAWEVRLTHNGTAFPLHTESWGASDGAGGVIVVWDDWRDSEGEEKEIWRPYAQRVSHEGETLWADEGVPVTTGQGKHQLYEVTSDGTGGVVIGWSAYPSGVPYVKRLDAEGAPVWQKQLPSYTSLSSIHTVSANPGEVIVAYTADADICVERIGPEGNWLWQTGRVRLNVDPGNIGIAGDGSGGAVVVWESEDNKGDNLYAQKIDGEGNLLWQDEGVSLLDLSGRLVQVISDGSGGAVVLAQTPFSAASAVPGTDRQELHAGRISAEGSLVWHRVMASCGLVSITIHCDALNEEPNGTIITWWYRDYPADQGIAYAQKLDAEGNPLWGDSGVAVYTSVKLTHGYPKIVSDGSGGAVVIIGDRPILAQRLSHEGELLWKEGGVQVL